MFYRRTAIKLASLILDSYLPLHLKEQNILLKGFSTNTTQSVQISTIFLLKTHFIFKDYREKLKKIDKNITK